MELFIEDSRMDALLSWDKIRCMCCRSDKSRRRHIKVLIGEQVTVCCNYMY